MTGCMVMNDKRKRCDEKPLVSVILIAYNQRRYIRQAIESVLAQETSFPYELLIGDDASDDGTSGIVAEYARAYPDIIKAFIRPENVGAARNAVLLLQQARGELIASLEGDDYWIDPRKLEKQAAFLRESPGFIGCTSRIRCVDENGRAIRGKPEWIRQKRVFTLADFDGVHLPGQASSLMRRNIFRAPSHDYSVLTEADTMISDRTAMLIFLLQGDFYCFDQPMSVYRYVPALQGGNVTSQLAGEASIVRDAQITRAMERYAYEEFGRRIVFSRFRRELYAKAWVRAVLGRSETMQGEAAQLRGEDGGWCCVVLLPLELIKLTWRRCVRRLRSL